MHISIKYQDLIIQEIKKGNKQGILNGESWEYIITAQGKHIIWQGKGISDITKRLKNDQNKTISL